MWPSFKYYRQTKLSIPASLHRRCVLSAGYVLLIVSVTNNSLNIHPRLKTKDLGSARSPTAATSRRMVGPRSNISGLPGSIWRNSRSVSVHIYTYRVHRRWRQPARYPPYHRTHCATLPTVPLPVLSRSVMAAPITALVISRTLATKSKSSKTVAGAWTTSAAAGTYCTS